MCVIIVKPRGIKKPSVEILKAAYRANSDGCGFVSENDYYRTMDFNKFVKRLYEVSDDENVIIHFRWATHGSVKLQNCHPFKYSGLYFAHNGVIGISPQGDRTDSETLFRSVLYPACKAYGYDSRDFDESCSKWLGSSKFAFMKDGEIKIYGNYSEMNGLYYSNLRFLSANLQQSAYCRILS